MISSTISIENYRVLKDFLIVNKPSSFENLLLDDDIRLDIPKSSRFFIPIITKSKGGKQELGTI